MKKNELDGILFDLDGTLVDTARDISANLNRAFQSLDLPQLPHETILSHVGYGAKYLVAHCLQHTRPDIQVDDQFVTALWEKFRDHYREHLVDHAAPYPGVVRFLETCPLPMAVISNKPEEFVQGVLKGLHLDHHFRFMWGKDTLPVSKPNPEVIRYGLHELNLQSNYRVVMVGDSPVDIQAAKGAGVISVALSHGFAPREQLESEAPDFHFQHFEDFAQTLFS